MKRVAAYLVLGLGIFLLVLGLAVKFVVAPRAVTAPLQIPSKYRTLVATGDNFQFLSPKSGTEETITVNITRRIQGDVNAGTSSVAVYDESLCLTRDDGTHPGCVDKFDDRLITNSTDRIAFDRKTGLAVSGKQYGANVDGDTDIAHVGLGYKFPIDTKKKTYQFFDTVAGKPFPMNYTGTEKLKGLTVYKFVQTITNQSAYTNHTLPSTYSNTRTVWVEPTTGVIVKGSEDLNQVLTGRANLDPSSELRDPTLQDKVALKGFLQFTDGTVSAQAQLAKDNLPKIALIRLWLPLVGVILGVVFLVIGVLMSRRGGGQPVPAGRRTHASNPDEDTLVRS